MRLALLPAAALVACAALTAGCGGSASDSSASSASASPSTTASPSPTATASTAPSPSPDTASASPSTTASASASATTSTTASGMRRCPQQGKYQALLVTGSVDCATAYAVTAEYDFDGDKRQTVEGFVCETGNAMTRPTVLTCTNRKAGTEFSIDER